MEQVSCLVPKPEPHQPAWSHGRGDLAAVASASSASYWRGWAGGEGVGGWRTSASKN